jgi:uncharacterized protein (TIGR00251 family)
MLDALREVEDGVVVRLWVMPGASETAVDEYDDWRKSLKFKTKEPAQKDAANRSVLGFFSSLLGKKTVLQKGARSRQKEVLVLGATLKEVSGKIRH